MTLFYVPFSSLSLHPEDAELIINTFVASARDQCRFRRGQQTNLLAAAGVFIPRGQVGIQVIPPVSPPPEFINAGSFA